ncbi:unnamed protein product [Bursaphelenchus xylophilus]|uniref:(pine wood nematode) hypothetical protein n=1 Tax=Bursaphelenchus xylophilus TaxID=6326 RepID=A0A1I7SVZ6_BURXY|nr:unnamed protein product [Bursaphelenchus xylophilus]CAG9098559.1 unnamed protein product [Bursaphelenchus xylophilus]
MHNFPVPPLRSSSVNEDGRKWREPIGVILAVLLGAAVLFSVICLFVYARRDSNLYEELVDYLDKTVSISKINFNPALGTYEIKDREVQTLSESRKYKTLIYLFLGCDAATLFFVSVSIMLFYTADVEKGTLHFVFWLFLIVGCVYSILEASAFSFFLFPFSAKLPNATEALLDHAVPHNPGGLLQMEHRLGCTFEQNLYQTFQRKQNPRNTCDPAVVSTFIPQPLLVSFVILRVAALLTFIILAACRRPIGEPVANLINKTKPKEGYKAKYIKNKKSSSKIDSLHTPKSTTFGTGKLTPQISSPVSNTSVVDHNISYNNAAYFAVAHATVPIGSSRSSDISKSDAGDLYKTGSIHTQNSLVSEV